MNLTREEAQQIFHDYSPYVYRIALFMTKSTVCAEDILQDTFIQIIKRYHTFDSTKPFRPWIYKVTLNTVRKNLRKKPWLYFWDAPPEQSSLFSVENVVLRNEGHSELWKEVSNLKLKSREIIFLHYYLELKLSEISEILGIPLGTCKSRLNHALKKLRSSLLGRNLYTLEEIGGR